MSRNGWNLLHERMAFMARLIEAADTDPHAAIAGLSESEVSRLFGDEDGLFLSLRQRWLTMLSATLDEADYEGIAADQAMADLAAAQPGLRALLDVAARQSLRVRALSRGEQRMVELFEGSTDDRKTVA